MPTDRGPTATDPSVRGCRPGDVAQVLALWESLEIAAASIPDTEDGVATLLALGGDALLVAEAEGRIVGALIAAFDGWRGNFYRLAVAPELRRRGIARALVEAGEQRLRALGARRITALVAADDDAAGLWAAAGYRHDTRVARFVKNV